MGVNTCLHLFMLKTFLDVKTGMHAIPVLGVITLFAVRIVESIAMVVVASPVQLNH